MLQTTCPDLVENLWNQTETLFKDLGTISAEINEMWAEISSMFRDVSPEEGFPPGMVADYLVGSLQQLRYMQRATELLLITREINDRNKAKLVMAKMNALRDAITTMDQEYPAKVFEPETAEAFLGFHKTIVDYPCDLKKLQASAMIAAYTPMFYIRDAFAGYLDRPRPSAEIFKMLLDITKDVAIDFLGPVVGVAKAIAKASHDHSEGKNILDGSTVFSHT
jgi:hypothetical protein